MSESKHTPGPWYIQHNTQFWEVRASTPDGWGLWLGDSCASSCDGDMPLGEANARLMAAAPCLLAACKYALARFMHGPEAITNPNDPIMSDLRAAITKAEGGAA